MELLADAAFLARLQFTFVVIVHFIFVPLSIGMGLIMAINETRYYKSRNPKDAAITKFWAKIFTTTFAIGVATGITMEFSFGTNWADYSRFVADIFGAPLAAEALLAFFLESVFLGIVLLGRNKVSPKFYLVSTWLVWFGSCLSALWILIANSWMQTPAGAELSADGSKAVMTDFLAAAFNPSTLARYSHTVLAVLVVGGFAAIAIAAYYLRKDKHNHFVEKMIKTGTVVALVSTCCLLVSAHSSAVVVAEQQPTKLAMMEGHYEEGTLPLYAVGWVDTEEEEVIAPLSLPGFTSFLATGDFEAEYPGLNDIAEENSDIVVEELPVQAVFQNYHLMVAMFGLICVVLLVALFAAFGKKGGVRKNKWAQRLLMISPLFPMLAIMAGWLTAELGRQPYVVYPSTSAGEGIELLTNNAISQSVTPAELILTLLLFAVVYVFIVFAYARLIRRFVKEGPEEVSDFEDASDSKETATVNEATEAATETSGDIEVPEESQNIATSTEERQGE